MITCGPILDRLADQLNDSRDTADPDWKLKLMNKLNQAYGDVSTMNDCNWTTFRSSVDITTALLPADMVSIRSVRDDNNYFYHYIGGPKRQSRFPYNWYYDTSVESALDSGTDLSVGEYGTALTSSADFPATTCAGEYIQIEANPGMYKIDTWTSTSAMALVRPFRGDDVSSGRWTIRPVGTKQIALADANGNARDIGTLTVEYKRMPLPLYHDEDLIELPGDCEAVYIKALQHILALKTFSTAARLKKSDFDDALAKMKSLEPHTPLAEPTQLFARRRIRTRDRFVTLYAGRS